MNETLTIIKERLKAKYLGKEGVHGLGISELQQAIRVYASPKEGPEQKRLLEQLRHEAAPFSVIIVPEEKPKLSE
jgi:hypothetical protein